MATIYLTKENDVTVNVNAIGEQMMLAWLFLHHDYDKASIGDITIESKWHPCEGGSYYRDGERGKYLYDVSYINTSCDVVNLNNIEIDTDYIMNQLKDISVDYNKFAEGYLAAAKYDYVDQNVKSYTNERVTKLCTSVTNPVSGQSELTVYFECATGVTKLFKPVVAFHGNCIYTDIEYIGTNEDGMEVFNLRSKADKDHVISLEINYDNILIVNAYRMAEHNGMLVHE